MTSNFYRGVSWTVRSWRTYGGVYLRKENAFIIKSPKRVINRQRTEPQGQYCPFSHT